MAQITSLYVFKVVSQASPGVETRDLMGKLGLPVDGPTDPDQMVSSSEYYDFFAELVDRDPNGLSLPLRIGAAMRSDEYGAFGLVWKSAPTLRGSFTRAERYGHVLGSAETYSLEETTQGFLFNLEKAGDGCPGMLLSNEASMSAVYTISKEASSSNFVPLAIHFKHAPSALTAGFVFSFASVVMPGIGNLTDKEFIRAFQAIDGVIEAGHPVFGLVWIGSVFALVAAAILAVLQHEGLVPTLVVASAVVYTLGVQLPTFLINVLGNESIGYWIFPAISGSRELGSKIYNRNAGYVINCIVCR